MKHESTRHIYLSNDYCSVVSSVGGGIQGFGGVVDMKILVACEYSGVVREAFSKKGHDVWSCDLLPSDIPSEKHYQGDVFDIIEDGWDMMIAHPPCTYLSNAGAKHLYKGKVLNQDRYMLGLQAKTFFEKLYNSNISKICIENPISSKVFEMPNYTQEIQPFQFGHPVTKKTRLWLKNLPLLIPTNIVTPNVNCHEAGTWFMKGGKDRQKNRAKTFEGIASGMADQWG